MVTSTFAPLSIEMAADADGVMREQLDLAETAARELVAARAAKREAQLALDDREAELTLQALTANTGERTTADVRKASAAVTIAHDPAIGTHRRALADAQHRIEHYEAEHDIAIRRSHAARAVLEYSTAAISLYASGGRLT
jgi:hypothetical protein